MDYKFDTFYKKWSLGNNLISLGGFASSLILRSPDLWIAVSLVSFTIYIYQMRNFITDFPWYLGYANWITTLRLLIVLTAVNFWSTLSPTLLFLIFLLVIFLDGVDGAIARKLRQTSKPGEYLDMETDALFVFLLSYMHYSNGTLPYWILIPGGLRYFYGIMMMWAKMPKKTLPSKKIRSAIALFFFIALLLPLIFKAELYLIPAGISSLLIIISFGISAVNTIANQLISNQPSDSA